jgi:hypothetical protein
MQVGRVVAAVAAVGAVVSGCGGPVQAGSAAIVGDTSVPLATVQTELADVLARIAPAAGQQDKGAQIAQFILTSDVQHELLQRQATALGITVSDPAVDAYIADHGGLKALLKSSGLDEPGLREQVRDTLVSANLGRRAVGGLQVTADIVTATSKDEAMSDAHQLAAGGAGAAALFSDPTTSKRGGVYPAASVPDTVGTVLFGAPVGDTVYFQPNSTDPHWLVVKVTARRTDATPDPAALSQVTVGQLSAIGLSTLRPVADKLGVRINPRYGVWDRMALSVVATDQAVGIVAAPTAG